MPSLRIEAGDETEALVQYVTSELDAPTLDAIDVDRDVAPAAGVASEPITVAVTITLGTAAVAGVLRLVERWMEHRRQAGTLRIVANGFAQSDEAGRALATLAAKHADVSMSYGLAKESWKPK